MLGLGCSGYTVLPGDNTDKTLRAEAFFFFFLFFKEEQAAFKAGLPSYGGRRMGPRESCCRNAEPLHDAAQLLAGPLRFRGPSLLPPAEDHKRIPTGGLLTVLKSTSLPKPSLGERAEQKEGLRKSQKQSSLCNKVISLW